MDQRGIYYTSTHKELIARLGQIDAVAKRQSVDPSYLEERRNILEHLSKEGVIELKNDGFTFIGQFQGQNRLLYVDTIDCT